MHNDNATTDTSEDDVFPSNNLATTTTTTSTPSSSLMMTTMMMMTMTTEEFYPVVKQPLHMIVIYTIAYLVVFVLSVVGNSLVVAVVWRNPQMHSVTNYFIVNLAIADILVSVFCLPITLMSNLLSGQSLPFLRVCGYFTHVRTILCMCLYARTHACMCWCV